MFEGTTAKDAEQAYHRTVEHLTGILVEDGILRCVRLKLESKKRRKKKTPPLSTCIRRITTANGEIHFDFEHGASDIVQFADWDTVRTNIYAKMVIRYVIKCKYEDLPKETLLGFER